MTTPLIDKVVESRIGMIRKEICGFFPDTTIEVATAKDGRAVIKMLQENWVIGMEFVETGTTWNEAGRFRDYYITLVNKCRLGVIVPVEHAMTARMRMLEFNQRWLFYYQVYSYDADGNLRKVGRPFGDDDRRGIAQTMSGYI
jgi:hypothetical protein